MHRLLIASLILLFPIALVSNGTSEFRLQQGPCDDDNAWWCVSEYENGFLVSVHGVDCGGNTYHKKGWRVVSSDPMNGEPPTETGVDESGRPWRAVIHVSNGRVIWQGGQASDGTYWVYDESTGIDVPGLQ
jgi:hypothetical protein